MGYRAHVAKKYDVRYDAAFFVSEFENNLCSIREFLEYKELIIWHNDCRDEFELNKTLLMKAKEDSRLSKELHSFINEMLDSCDPELDYVRIDCF